QSKSSTTTTRTSGQTAIGAKLVKKLEILAATSKETKPTNGKTSTTTTAAASNATSSITTTTNNESQSKSSTTTTRTSGQTAIGAKLVKKLEILGI
ncbi:unnamed protein product, partial [Rotaria sp. Silwood1]